MKVRFYDFSKRRNSTKQPPSTGYTEKEVYLKESTSIKNPSFVMNATNFSWNYAYIPDWNRYYFVDDIISITKDTTQYDLTEDVLATNKSAIGSTVARIAYASTLYDAEIIDNRINVHTTKQIKGSLPSQASGFNSTGCYVLTVYNNALTPASTGFSQSYVMSQDNIYKVKSWLGESAVMNSLANYFLGSPLEAIFGCIWVPFDYSAVSGTGVDHVVIGNQSSTLWVGTYGNINAKLLAGTGIVSYTATLPIHLRYNDFRRCQPYTTGSLYLPGIGSVDINLNEWFNEANIYVSYNFEYATGNVSYLIFNSTGMIMQTATCNVASQCPLGQVTSDGGRMISAITTSPGKIGGGAIGGFVSGGIGGAIMGAGGGLLKAAGDMVLAFSGRGTSISGSSGSRMSSLIPEITYTEVSCDTEDCDSTSYIAQRGRPVAVTHAISNHSGFVCCDGASVSIGGESWERDEVNAYLNGGFFYE